MQFLQRLLHLSKSLPLPLTRTFLSPAYPCTELWNRRLDSPLLKKINPRDLFLELDKNLTSTGKVSAVDIDLFAHTINEVDATDEFLDILHRFRMTAETSSIMESTHHAVVRFFLDNNHLEELLIILDDRLNYGIFPDHYSLALILDHFLKSQDYVAAVKVASLLMLQEDLENPVCNALALYSCGKLLELGFEDWKLPEVPQVDPKEEVVKIRVRYLRNPFFDDHFDLKDPKAITGKTIWHLGKPRDDVLGRSCQILGAVLWGKQKIAAELVAKWRQGGGAIYREAGEKIEAELKGLEAELRNEGKEGELEEIENLRAGIKGLEMKEGKMLEEMEADVKNAVLEHEGKIVQDQIEVFGRWEKARMAELQRQLDELDRQKRLEKVEEMKEELKKQERLLTFFEYEEDIELKIEEKLEREHALYGPKRVVKADAETKYIPPEVKQRSVDSKR